MVVETLSQTGQSLDDINNELHELAMEFNDNNDDQELLKDSPVHTALYNEGLVTKDTHTGNLMDAEYKTNGGDNMDKTTLTNLIIKWMKDGWLKMRDQKPYKLEDMLNQDKNINSNGILNLEDKTIQDITNDGGTLIKFETFEELFDVAQLTIRIRTKLSGKKAKSEKPFHCTAIGRIEFDNTERWKFRKGDLDILKRRTIKEISPTLRENKEFYVEYLNKWRENGGREPGVY